MALDSIFLLGLTRELSREAEGAFIDKIHMTQKDEIILALRACKSGGTKRLALSLNPSFPAVYFTSSARENPAQPPMFCMLMRKHLGGGRIVSVTQPEGERILIISVSVTGDMGDRTEKKLIIELMGRRTNLVVTDADGSIIDCLKRVSPDDPEQRKLLPGLFYAAPEPLGKPFFPSCTLEALGAAAFSAPRPVTPKALLQGQLSGVSPLVLRELCFSMGIQPEQPLEGGLMSDFLTRCASLSQRISEGAFQPAMILQDGVPADFCYIDITQYGESRETVSYPSFFTLLDAFYSLKGKAEDIKRRAKDLIKCASGARGREEKKLNARRSELMECENREKLRLCGELITANMYKLRRGMTSFSAEDYTKPDCPETVVELDPLLTPQQNAARYYKRYKKAKTAEEYLTRLISQGENEIEYLDSVVSELGLAESGAELEEIRQELISSGYLSRPRQKGGKVKSPPPLKPLRCASSEGFDILVGKNNRQNEEVTFRLSSKSDLWFHAKGYHGAHVVVRCRGEQPGDATVSEAAALAAKYSGAQSGAKIAVDYTAVRNVKKNPGAKPGMVLFDNYETVFVEG